MEGMIVGDYYSDKELMHEFQTNMARYVQEGQVKVFEHVTEGIANAGRAFIEVSWLWRRPRHIRCFNQAAFCLKPLSKLRQCQRLSHRCMLQAGHSTSQHSMGGTVHQRVPAEVHAMMGSAASTECAQRKTW